VRVALHPPFGRSGTDLSDLILTGLFQTDPLPLTAYPFRVYFRQPFTLGGGHLTPVNAAIYLARFGRGLPPFGSASCTRLSDGAGGVPERVSSFPSGGTHSPRRYSSSGSIPLMPVAGKRPPV